MTWQTWDLGPGSLPLISLPYRPGTEDNVWAIHGPYMGVTEVETKRNVQETTDQDCLLPLYNVFDLAPFTYKYRGWLGSQNNI